MGADNSDEEMLHKEISAQIMGYLAITGLELGLLINFKHARLDWKYIARSRHES